MKIKVKKDEQGLYLKCGGYISRPMGTDGLYEEGQTVWANHPGGPFVNVRTRPGGRKDEWLIQKAYI